MRGNPRAPRVQGAVTSADINRLDVTASQVRDEITSLRRTDPTLARDVEASLDDLTDEITYLRVKMREEGAVTRDEYASLRDRLETLRVKGRGERGVGAAGPAAARSRRLGARRRRVRRATADLAQFRHRAKVEQRFEATTVLDYVQGGAVLVPAGATVRGFVSSVRPAGKIDRRGSSDAVVRRDSDRRSVAAAPRIGGSGARQQGR